MNRSPLLLTNDVHFCVSGPVTVHPTAAIATNVTLRANPGSHLVIGAGVVIGKGSILQSYGGTLTLEDGVTLGTQVLLVGQGVVARHACIGSMSTLMANIAVREGEMIPPNSLLGEPVPSISSSSLPDSSPLDRADSQSVAPSLPENSAAQSSSEAAVSSTPEEALPHPDSHRMFMPIRPPRYNGAVAQRNGAIGSRTSQQSPSSQAESVVNESSSLKSPNTDADSSLDVSSGQKQEKSDSIGRASNSDTVDAEAGTPAVIYGKASVQRLMTMMFPHRTLSDSGDG